MNELFSKIFDAVASQDEQAIKIVDAADELIKVAIAPYKEQLNDEELDRLENLLYFASLTGQQAGFEIGVRFAIRLLSLN